MEIRFLTELDDYNERGFGLTHKQICVMTEKGVKLIPFHELTLVEELLTCLEKYFHILVERTYLALNKGTRLDQSRLIVSYGLEHGDTIQHRIRLCGGGLTRIQRAAGLIILSWFRSRHQQGQERARSHTQVRIGQRHLETKGQEQESKTHPTPALKAHPATGGGGRCLTVARTWESWRL